MVGVGFDNVKSCRNITHEIDVLHKYHAVLEVLEGVS